jgi:predicted Fe-S protein YdhL (DUF1289 family)
MAASGLNCYDCGSPIMQGGVIQHEHWCDAAPGCACEKTAYCDSCMRRTREIAKWPEVLSTRLRKRSRFALQDSTSVKTRKSLWNVF